MGIGGRKSHDSNDSKASRGSSEKKAKKSMKEQEIAKGLLEDAHVDTSSSSSSSSSMSEGEVERRLSVPAEMGVDEKHRTQRLSSVVIDIDKNIIAPEEAVSLTFSGISVTVERKDEHKNKVQVPILSDVWGAAPAGELVGIMGSSGAGKTTLLNTLSGRLGVTKALKYSGSIADGDTFVTPRQIRQTAAYVRQDDVLLETLTVRETLYFAAKLRLPRNWPDRRRKRLVDYVIEELGLNKCADTKIGNTEKRGISGGERKRVSIGVELITSPKLIFLDEPTSGLDSFTAASVMKLLKRLAAAGRTVVCTIHQPSSEIYATMDKLMLLSKGQTIYYGPPVDAVQHFAKLGYVCNAFTNPADFCVEVAYVDVDKFGAIRKAEDEKKVRKFVDAMQPPTGHRSLRDDMPGHKSNYVVQLKESLPACSEFPVLMWRSWLHFIRTPAVTKARLFQTLFVSLLVGLLYLQIGDSQSSVQNRQGAIFFSLSSVIMTAVQSAVLNFPSEKPLFLHEQDNFMYRPASYFWGKTFVEIPSQIVFPIIFSAISYFLVGFQLEVEKVFYFFITMVFLANAGNSLGLMLGCIIPNAEAASTLSTVTIIPFMLFSGLFIQLDSIPVYFRWIQYLSLWRYGYEALAINEFTGLNFTCTKNETVYVPCPSGTCPRCPIPNGESVLEQLGFDGNSFWVQNVVILALFALFRLLGWLALEIYARKRRASA